MDQYVFSAGALFYKPSGNSPTPMQFGALQGVTLTASFAERQAYGRNVFPLKIMRGAGKLTGQAHFASIDARLFSDLVVGNSAPSSGAIRIVTDEPHTVSSASANAAHAANFVGDLGVVRASNSAAYERVLSGPIGRQYTCNETTGVYGFDSPQNGKDILLRYSWQDSSSGSSVALQNQQQAASPYFQIVLNESFQGQQMTVVLNACCSTKLSAQFSKDDFTIPQFEFVSMQDSNGVVGTISLEWPSDLEFAGQVNLVAPANCGLSPSVGLTISGLDAAATYLVTEPYGLPQVAWSAFPSGNLWQHAVYIGNGNSTLYQFGDGIQYSSPEQARAAFVGGNITGFSNYTFWINDNNPFDDRGGLSVVIWKYV